MIKLIKNSYRELFLFLKKPVDKPDNNTTLNEKILKLFLILILDLVISTIIILLLSILEKYGLFSTENYKLELLKSMSKSEVIILCIIVIPIIEELIFRLYLRYKNNYLLRLLVSLFYITGRNRKNLIEKRIKKIWYSKYGYIFYFSAILFGFVHILNYDLNKNLLIFMPIITLPQIFVGILAGYLRVRFNLIWGYLLHAIHNLVCVLPFLFIGNNYDDLTNTDNYFIKIEETVQEETNPKFNIYRDSIYVRKAKLKNIIAFTNNTNVFLVESNNIRKMDKEYNLTYKNKSDSNFINRKVINKYLMDSCNYKINWESRPTKSWKLVVEDSLKLISYRTDSVRGSYVNVSKDSASIHRVELNGIAYAIQESTSKNIFLKDKIDGRYNIKLNTADTTDIKKQLRSIYGLNLTDTIAEVNHLIINFENIK
ncbi:CPBP family intramembrane metalloprotease [Wenyingzhuangia sp. chi5]|uniref:CPBP family intramembrane metalloprotease n=1 Tax=Wenyingzhuangia gilva TaxID=3057677 RepID=A0ABT8VSU9_9FLAO|nr:CPBP family intramembrane glutamic endopeptidase [Wenyingzhuangia sp. chi5]MDO3695059.1 CPBP family intramembrane metalloprotease [Wenyingzhuangia sp. chi5]